MNIYNLQVETNSVGGYFSSEQIDLISIIQCNSNEKVIEFINNCRQLKGVFNKDNLYNFLSLDLEQLKQIVFKAYQNTLVLHDCKKSDALDNTLLRLGLMPEDIDYIKKAYSGVKDFTSLKTIGDYIKSKYPDNYEEIIRQVHCFVCIERDQNKSENLYNELSILNNNLGMFNTLLIDSAKPEIVINNLLNDDSENKIDFYHAERDLDFAYRNNKHIRFHTLLSKNACEQLFSGASKEEIIKILTAYVKKTIDFINRYNETHKLKDGTPVINAVDLFNEIVSFDKNEDGVYENIWETKYGITLDDICNIFEYAKENKPTGVNYLYNEPFLEDDERRTKVLETLEEIDKKSPGLIDTLGSQMHITLVEETDRIKRCFEDFRLLQERTGKHIQITEFDMSLSKKQIPRVISINGSNPDISLEDVYKFKQSKIELISKIINESGVKIDGISYWSLTDGIDANLQRIRTIYLNDGSIADINQIQTVCGGLIPVYNQIKKNFEYQEIEESYRHI